MAVTRIDDKVIMTVKEMEDKYPTKWIRYFLTSEVNIENPEEMKGYVMFIGDTDIELYDLSKYGYTGEFLCSASGIKAVSPVEIGGIYYHD